MKSKTFLILLVAAGVLVALSLFRSGGERHTGAVKMGDKLFPDLPVNKVATVAIADADHRVTVAKGDKLWRVTERSGYPADFDALRDMLIKLSRLKIGRSFAGTPDSLARLSLLAPDASAESGKGTQITLSDSSGKTIADVILGQTRQIDSGGVGGQYLKKAGGNTVYLVDGNFRFLKSTPAQWLKKEILDLKADDIASVTCYAGAAQTPVYKLTRPKKGANAQLTPLPKGRQADMAKIDQVLEALSPLNLDDVKAGGSNAQAAESGGPRLVYRLYDGRQITIYPAATGKDSYTVRIAAEAVAPEESTPETKPAQASGKDAEEGKAQAAETAPADKGATVSPAPKTVQQLNEAFGPWVFMIKKWQFDSFIAQPAGLLKEMPKKGKGAGKN